MQRQCPHRPRKELIKEIMLLRTEKVDDEKVFISITPCGHDGDLAHLMAAVGNRRTRSGHRSHRNKSKAKVKRQKEVRKVDGAKGRKKARGRGRVKSEIVDL